LTQKELQRVTVISRCLLGNILNLYTLSYSIGIRALCTHSQGQALQNGLLENWTAHPPERKKPDFPEFPCADSALQVVMRTAQAELAGQQQ